MNSIIRIEMGSSPIASNVAAFGPATKLIFLAREMLRIFPNHILQLTFQVQRFFPGQSVS
jgi:hypothetical protein